MKTLIEMARLAGAELCELPRTDAIVFGVDDLEWNSAALQRFALLVRADEREAIMDEWWMCVQSDLENGVKSLNERAAEKWKKEYPAIAGFAATIEARGSKKTKENQS